MTGRDLIIYILENHLEDVPVITENGVILGFMDETEAAAKFTVGPQTIRAWIRLNMLDAIKINDRYYIPKNAEVKKQ